MEVASRVLILAKSLEDNANEIEAINRSVNPLSYSGQSVASSPAPRLNTDSSTPETSTTINLDEPENNTNTNSKEPEPVENGLVYKIQLGAFSKEPSRSDFKALGKIKISLENGMYKVLFGSYVSKEEAFKQREQIIGKGFDGFVVSYQDGIRVK